MGWYGNWYGGGGAGGGGGGPIITNNTTTEDAIRDQIIAVIKALAPTFLVADKFDPWRDEADAEFRKYAKANPNNCWRRFQVRDTGERRPPEISNCDVAAVFVTFEIVVAYGQSSRAGNLAARDRDKVICSDEHLIRHAVGLEGYANFTGATFPNASFIEDDPRREREDGVDFLVIKQVMRFYRRMVP